MLISPEIYSYPYTEKQFLEMKNKLDSLCQHNYSSKLLSILEQELYSSLDDSLILTESILNDLENKMRSYAKESPCADIFYHSIFKELYNTFKNEPIKHFHDFIQKLTLLSKS